jgi:HAD superfamily hydrolase (TIGR01459 family)
MIESAAQQPPLALSGLSTIEDRYDAVLCDIWGVLHNGARGFAAAAEALRRFRHSGRPVALITNAPRPDYEVREQLESLGIGAECHDDIATSGDVCARAIIARAPSKAFHIGPARDLPLFDAASRMAGRQIRPVALEAAGFAVCTGLVEDTVETPADYEAVLAACRTRNLPMICANPDLVVYRGEQLVYCAGALAERYVEMGGEVEQAGKPYPPIYRTALAMLEKQRGARLDLSRVLAIGDAMHTDIAGAQGMGIDCLWITTGVHRADLHGPGNGSGDELDAEAMKQFFEDHDTPPTFHMDRLSW